MADLKTTAEERARVVATPGAMPWVKVLYLVHDLDTLLAENARLRAVAEAARRADVVIHFDLQRMVIFGPDYNQAVKDVGDALHEALAALEAP